MMSDINIQSREQLFFSDDESELRRELFEQFRAGAIEKYGVDSEQARMMLQLLETDTSRPN